MICMKNLGKFVKAFRLHPDRGWSTAQMAAAVTRQQAPGKPEIKRQHIEQLEAAGDRIPRYVVALARAMGTTTDALLAGEPSTQPEPGHDIDQPSDAKGPELLRTALNILAICLHDLDIDSRTEAGYLLQKMAESPGGRWSGRLSDLIEKEAEPYLWEAICNSDRAGKYSLSFQKQTTRMKQKSGSQPSAAVAASHLPTGQGDAASGGDRREDEKGSSDSATGAG